MAEVARRIQEMTGCEQATAYEEVELTIQRLFHWGAYADKYGGTVQVSILHNLSWCNSRYQNMLLGFIKRCAGGVTCLREP